jgi:hypothetical protein
VPKIANMHVNITEIENEMLGCVLACIQKIQEIISGARQLVLDEDGEIFNEYRQQLSLSGQPGLGDSFIQWVHDNQWSKCDRIKINKTDPNHYIEFPNTPALSKFDKSDIKFVAVANACKRKPTICVAIDRGWWTHKQALEDSGITVDFLCPDQIAKSSERSKKRKKLQSEFLI